MGQSLTKQDTVQFTLVLLCEGIQISLTFQIATGLWRETNGTEMTVPPNNVFLLWSRMFFTYI